MPHDKNGTKLEVGDLVNIACRVVAIHMESDYCNLSLELCERMPAYPDQVQHYDAINARQVVKHEQ